MHLGQVMICFGVPLIAIQLYVVWHTYANFFVGLLHTNSSFIFFIINPMPLAFFFCGIFTHNLLSHDFLRKSHTQVVFVHIYHFPYYSFYIFICAHMTHVMVGYFLLMYFHIPPYVFLQDGFVWQGLHTSIYPLKLSFDINENICSTS